MNRFIDIQVVRAQDRPHPSANVRVQINPDILFFLEEKHFPFKVIVYKTHGNEIVYQSDLNVNHWCSFNFFENCTLKVSTLQGVEIGRTQWNSLEHGTQTEIAFDLWCAVNPNTKGVAIGTNDGTSGEWVNQYHNQSFSKIMLVEASEFPFLKLERNYGNKQNVTLVNKLVTPNGGNITFYEALEGEGHTNSVDKNHLLNYYSNIQEVEKESIGINELLLENGFNDLDWLHIDVEGLDDQLIMALDFNKISKPKVIIYEKVNNISNENLENFFHSNGYKIWVDDSKGFNNIAFLK